ncbi:hypothetical protein LEP1GSC202_0323 [Leptospira yanagawae serovar Saopaulo str. Sao Paulo = ATCC 700523]|uniref:Uncharacterized protein n=1 Tax=Leptospira yanagawae serovar Saopaulo str. Sao Paulo = ATCC 700523 TaxID=1249483 RepID=A0A5E8HCU6_9LEPT|nr:hypothetical protein LEP1GSC202_0323 [Leptospira yanagawae serovar Saopaulo str. Sao Paulo = ATCC 700523]
MKLKNKFTKRTEFFIFENESIVFYTLTDLPPFSVPMDKLVFSKHFNHKIA